MSATVKETKSGKGKVIAVIIVAAVFVILAVSVLFLRDSAGVKLSSDTQTITIYSGEGISEVAAQLKADGIIKYPMLFKLQAKAGGYDSGVQPGDAIIKNGMSYSGILELITTPNRSATKIVIPEGYEVRQIAETLCEAGLADWNRFYDALNNDTYDYKFLENLPERENKMEGYLFPATYEIPEGMTEHDIINLMLSAFDNQFKSEYYDRAAELNMTIDQVITLASIIERETDTEAERAKVAGVFYNRLRDNMKLQSCATVQYILGERKPVLAIADTQIDSPYNTYIYQGLPIGPIANPGLACIQAVLYPAETDAYYFVQGSNGQHVFSHTYEEHLAAMQDSDPTISVDSTAIENQDGLKQ